MTTNPSDESQPSGSTPPPAPSGFEAQVPPAGSVPPADSVPPVGSVPPPPGAGAVPPPAYGSTPPPAYGSTPPPAYGGPAPAYGTPGVAPMSDADQRLWATLAHVGGIILGFLAPLVVWLVYKDRGRFVEEQSKEALNFQITIVIGYVVSGITMIIGIGFLLFFVVWVISIVFAIMAAIAVNKGQAYRYPVTLRIIS